MLIMPAVRAGALPARAAIQLWSKAQPSGTAAVLVINIGSTWGNAAQTIGSFNFSLSEIPGLASEVKTVTVREVWSGKDLGEATGVVTTDAIMPGDNRLYLLAPKARKIRGG